MTKGAHTYQRDENLNRRNREQRTCEQGTNLSEEITGQRNRLGVPGEQGVNEKDDE